MPEWQNGADIRKALEAKADRAAEKKKAEAEPAKATTETKPKGR